MRAKTKQTLKGVGSVGLASGIAGVAGLVLMVVMAKVLSPQLNAEFMVFWSLLFWVFGSVGGGIQFETVRSVRTVHLRDENSLVAFTEQDKVRVVPAGLVMSVGVVMIIFLSSLLWAPRVFGYNWLATSAIICAAAIAFAGFSSAVGVLGGRGDWVRAALLMVADPLVRAVMVIAAVLALPGLLWVKAAAGLAALTWIVVVMTSKGYRSVLGARGDAGMRQYVGQVGQAIVANAANTALVVGFPTVLGLVVGYTRLQSAAGLLFAISMTRAPLMMPLNAFQSMIVAHFVNSGGSARAIGRIVVAVLGLGVVVSVAIGLVGPPLLGLLRSEYHLGFVVVGCLTLASVFLTLVVLTGTLVLANSRHTVYMIGWIVAIVVTVGMLWIPAPLTVAVIVALITGSSCGAVVHIVGLVRGRGNAIHHDAVSQ
ncbi:MAG: hypothetical protein FWF25_00280 [Propionibacteriaceae bacterium]|nr:hypothetical protein [Propionibacteriaceae bacterium]